MNEITIKKKNDTSAPPHGYSAAGILLILTMVKAIIMALGDKEPDLIIGGVMHFIPLLMVLFGMIMGMGILTALIIGISSLWHWIDDTFVSKRGGIVYDEEKAIEPTSMAIALVMGIYVLFFLF